MITLVGILGWIVFGSIVGFVATKLVNLRGDDPRMSIVLAAVAGVVGGLMYSWISGSPVSAFNIWSVLIAALAAGVAVAVWHFIRSRGTHQQPTIRRSY